MLRTWLFIALLIVALTACSSSGAEPALDDTAAVDSAFNNIDPNAGGATREATNDGGPALRGLGAHVHGFATMTLAWSGNDVEIALQTPAFNVVGFEYAPSTDEEIALMSGSLAAFEAGGLLQLSDAAGCTITSFDATSTLDDADLTENEAAVAGETHSEIRLVYALTCDNPDALEVLDVTLLFDRFPNFRAVELQWVSDTQASAVDLTPASPNVLLR